ncbi:CoA-disulfide reductase [Lachnoclostridium sp. An14]|uniref:CoA-disulfide reductase n=1 Tax=Lachnoclostridium sp. An14 TaxID=1965562 RepID=UPI000B38899A|nr:CoA-disulfide reductase [Lachnoclostridium sp. An14]OUQ21539.1 CoA-disulfide reductase [Lachnoclostridium sp. An14]
MKVVIIGGVAAGMSAASKLKRNLKDQVEIMVYEKGGEVSYGACGIPFYISDHIKQGRDLIARTAEEFSQSGIPIKTYHEVLKVDTDKKTVLVKNLKTGEEFTDSYDKLVIGSGAAVRHFPPFDQAYENLFEIRDVADGTRVKTALFDENNRHVVIVGAGFIGLEVSEACRRYGKEVTVVELADHILSSFDQEVSEALEGEMEKNGVTVKTGCRVTELKGENGRVTAVILQNGDETEELPVDILINSAGIAPATSFIDTVEKARNGAILVNERMETNVADVYAAGDCSIMRSGITGEYTYAPLGTNANKQGRIIGDLLGGVEPKPFKLIGSSALRLFGMDAAKVGLSEKEAKAHGLDYKAHTITGNSYASYYGTEKLNIKLIYDKATRKVLGAETWGQGIVVPRANYYAIAIYAGLTVDEMGFMDLCYSPPFSGVWDAALIASNTAK